MVLSTVEDAIQCVDGLFIVPVNMFLMMMTLTINSGAFIRQTIHRTGGQIKIILMVVFMFQRVTHFKSILLT